MRLFLKDILFGILLTVLIGYCIDKYECKKQSHTNFAYKQWYLDNRSEKIKTLLMGNSHFENSINPYVLGDSVFDLAISGRWIYYDVCLLQNNIDRMPNLKTVIYPMAYITPYVNPHRHFNNDIDGYYLTSYFRQMHIFYDQFPNNILYGSYFLSGQWGKDFAKVNPVKHCDSIGYARLDGSFDNWLENLDEVHNIVETNPYLKEDTAEYISYLKQMACLCNTHNVRLVVVTPPFHSRYNDATTNRGNKILEEIVSSVSTEYPMEYYNFATNLAFREDSIWSNYTHLNHIGATIFANQLKQILEL